MTVDEFINKSVGIKWETRRSDWCAMDCWGLVIMYYKYVLNIDLPFIDGYQYKDAEMSSLYVMPELAKNRWIRTDDVSSNDVVFMAYHKGEPCHVGIVIDGHYALHTNGNSRQGQVQYNRLEAVKRQYQKLEFYRYKNDNLSQ